MADLFDNPMGLTGFEFVEFAWPVAAIACHQGYRWRTALSIERDQIRRGVVGKHS
ncbi:hypothetical protein [Burkholderia sp. BCC1985]|uniref:hypothetical protein n=1 Tax=Burkholderia sp. BCC1985 TaxID=2817442 RepID=UPI002AB1078C|nr:hypothetical protein [Burkholderia sp. BCC1985]